MRGMNSESVDLIYLDPPYNSNTNYAAPIESKAARAVFKDTWGVDDINLSWHGMIKFEHPGIYKLLDAVQEIHGNSMKSSLIYMVVRFMEMKRLLKPKGSIYVHCDPAASHYLKLVMDRIFGQRKFRNEIVWKRNSSHNDSIGFGRVADYILFYGPAIKGDAVRVPLNPSHVQKFYRYEDARGLYSAFDLSAKGLSGGGYFYDFHGKDGP